MLCVNMFSINMLYVKILNKCLYLKVVYLVKLAGSTEFGQGSTLFKLYCPGAVHFLIECFQPGTSA